MLSTVASKPNHYERLGLEPDAGEEEIERAFAREMSAFRPHSVADMTEIALAFKTLRDPARRRAYDASIAPPPEPEAEPEPQAKPAMFPREGWPFIASARVSSADFPAIDSVARGGGAPPAEPVVASRQPRADVQAAPAERRLFERPQLLEEHIREDEDKGGRGRTAVTLGALFGGVAVLGAALGLYASRGIDPAQAQDVATVTLPEGSQAAAPDPVVAMPAQEASEPKAAPRRAAKPRRVASAPEPAEVEEQRAEDVPDIPSEQIAALTSEAASVPAALPLPNSVVARTIERIGYPCGTVASTSNVDGADGVFKVTCTSGAAYKATPVRGRYHFRRWGR